MQRQYMGNNRTTRMGRFRLPASHGIKPNCRIFLFCRSGFFTSAGNTGTLANNVAACFSRMAA